MKLKNQDIIKKNYPSLDRISVMKLSRVLELLKNNDIPSIASIRIEVVPETGRIWPSDEYLALDISYMSLLVSDVDLLVTISLYFRLSLTMYREAITCMHQIIFTEVRCERVY